MNLKPYSEPITIYVLVIQVDRIDFDDLIELHSFTIGSGWFYNAPLAIPPTNQRYNKTMNSLQFNL